MLPFKSIELKDKDIINSHLCKQNYRASDLCFTNLYSWGKKFDTQYATEGEWLFIRFRDNNNRNSYLKPVGGDNIKRAIETIDEVAVGDIRTKIRDILGSFMFGGEASEKKVKVLSGGERSRLAMIRLLLEPVNLLILDEPTNHLDLASKDVLKKAIREFDGTAIIVSHDRDFLDDLVHKVYEFGGGKVREHIGGIHDYLSTKKLDNLQQLELSKSPATTQQAASSKKEEKEGKSEATAGEPMEQKLSYQEQKELNRRQRRLEKQIEEAENEVEALETTLAAMEQELATPEGASNVTMLQNYLETKAKMDRILNNWERLTLELERL